MKAPIFKSILVTGHQGLIGREVIEELRTNKEIRRGIVSPPSVLRTVPLVYGFDSNESFNTWMLDFKRFENKVRDVDLIIHCGAISDSRCNDSRLWELNYAATQMLGEYAKSKRAKFLYFSSCAAIEPITPYGWSKRIGEDILTAYLPKEDLCIFRPFNVWAWNREANKSNPSIISKILDRTLEVVYRGCVRDFIEVSDVVSAVTLVMQDWKPGIFEIGYSIEVELTALVDDIYENLPLAKPLYVDECPIAKRLVCNPDFKLPNWSPKRGNAYMHTPQFAKHMDAMYGTAGSEDELPSDEHLVTEAFHDS